MDATSTPALAAFVAQKTGTDRFWMSCNYAAAITIDAEQLVNEAGASVAANDAADFTNVLVYDLVLENQTKAANGPFSKFALKVSADKRSAMYETLGLVNEQLWLGHFELWSSSGLIVFRYAALIDGGDEGLSFEHAEALSEAALEECERFYPVFQFVLWGGKSPGEAIQAALIETAGEA